MNDSFTVACAESCTGGLLMSRLTDFSGASAHFKGGIVAYSNEIKNKILNVKNETLEHFGAVSSQTALEMAANVRNFFSATIGLSTTGVAGSEKIENKPVGLVYAAIVSENFSEVKEFHFSGSRLEIKSQAAEATVKLLKKYTI